MQTHGSLGLPLRSASATDFRATIHLIHAPAESVQAVIDKHVQTTSESLAVEATAGAGKTPFLVEIERLPPDDLDEVFLAFNRDAAAQLRDKLRAPARSRTVHSLASAILSSFSGVPS